MVVAFQLNPRQQRQGQLETAYPKILRSLGGCHMVLTPAHDFEDLIWYRPNAGQLVKMAVLALGQIADPDVVTHFPQFFRVRLSKFFFVFFMDGRQLSLNLLGLTHETQEKIKGVFAPVFLHNGRHVPESNWIPPEQETVGRVWRYGTRKVIETPQCHRQFPLPLTGGCVGLL